MTKYWVGLASRTEFLQKLLGPLEANLPKLMFPAIRENAKNICKPFVETISKAGLCRKFTFQIVEHDYKASEPVDVLLYFERLLMGDDVEETGTNVDKIRRRKVPWTYGSCDWNREDGLVAIIKDSVEDDPFYDFDTATKKGEFEKTGEQHEHLRRHMVLCAREFFNRQPRTHMFQLFVAGNLARFIRWDRAGGVVTHSFDYTQYPHILAEFLLKYDHMSPTQRGWDPTVSTPTPAEADLFRTKIQQLLDAMKDPSSSQRCIPGAEKSLDEKWPVRKVAVGAGRTGSSRVLLVQKPFNSLEGTFCGKGTKAYLAYSLTDEKIVFFKDSWRMVYQSVKPEDEMYQLLEAAGVPSLPNVLCAGDVIFNEEIQTTYSRKWVKKPWVEVSAKQKFVHHRVVQDLLFPLETARSSFECVRAWCDALKAMDVAVEKANIMHGDIGIYNVMLNEEGRGVLNDWDYARTAKLAEGCKQEIRSTGTWDFMSIELLDDPDRIHDVADDMESVLWALTHHAAKYSAGIEWFNMTLFSYRLRTTKNGKNFVSGGLYKMEYLRNGTYSDLSFTCAPLRDLLEDLASTWKRYYARPSYRNPDPEYQLKRDKMRETFSKPSFWAAKFEAALARDDWEEAGVVPDRYPSETLPAELETLHILRLPKPLREKTLKEGEIARQAEGKKTARKTDVSRKKRKIDDVAGGAHTKEPAPRVKRVRRQVTQGEQDASEAGPSRPRTRSQTKKATLAAAAGVHLMQTRSRTKKQNGSAR